MYFGYVGVARYYISRTSFSDDVRDGNFVYLLKSIDKLLDTGAFACTYIVDVIRQTVYLRIEKVFNGYDVRVCQVNDVDVVANAGAIRSGVVITKDGERRTFLGHGLCEVGNEVIRHVKGKFPDLS